MKAIFATFGSFGDVKPFIWMARDLIRGGHDALLIANPHFKNDVEAEGIPFRPAGTEADYQAAATPAAVTGNRFHDQGERIAASRRLFTCMFMNPSRETYDIISESRGGDTVVIGHIYAYGARLAAERYSMPYVNACLSTYWLKGFVQPMGLASRMQRMSAASTTRFIDGQLFTKPMDALRAGAGLAPLRQSSARWMFSSRNLILLPQWLANFPLENGMDAVYGGFPQSAEKGALPPRMLEFLSRHHSPVIFTPGSAVTDARAFFAAALPALRSLGLPGIFLSRAAESIPAELPENVIHADYVPLELLLSHGSALVHHGGIGTAARALEAGVPQLLCPRMAEQQENARVLQKLGVCRSLPAGRLTQESLAGQLDSLMRDEAVRKSCDIAKEKNMNMPDGWIGMYLHSILQQI